MARPTKQTDDATTATKRIQMDMGPSSVARLQRLQRRTEAASYSETVRNALKLHERLLDALKDGSDLSLKKGGSQTMILLALEDTERSDENGEGKK